MSEKYLHEELNLTHTITVDDLQKFFKRFDKVDYSMHVNIDTYINDKDEVVLRIKERVHKIDDISYIVGKEEGFEEGKKWMLAELQKYQDRLNEIEAENERLVEEKMKEIK